MLTWCEIRSDALRHNLAVLRRAIGPKKELVAMVKANAYGHGLREVARLCAAEGISWFGVIDVEEAVLLREALGPGVRLLILGYVEPDEIAAALAVGADLAVFDRSHAIQIQAAAAASGGIARVHLKIDTGMGRHGIFPEEAPAVVEQFWAWPNLILEGVWTHLAQADALDPTYTEHQLERWSACCDRMQQRGLLPPMLHVANSAGALLYPSARGTAVRCGIALYGLWPHPSLASRLQDQGLQLQPLLTWKSRLVQVKTVPAHTAISYGSTYWTHRETLLGVISVGYADGYDRGLSNVGQVLVRGVRCPVLGRVCMKHLMVDLGPAARQGPPPQVGEEVVLAGRQGNAEIPVDEMAAWVDTINYEITTRLPERIPRLVKEGP